MRKALCVLLPVLTTVVGCGDDDDGARDLGGADLSDGRCVSDADCDDGVFCNGVERCIRGGLMRDERDCVMGDSPCEVTDSCDEPTASCVPCVDEDGDGACASRDCDDSDPRRGVGFEEVCDADHVDEDCDPSTFGERDADGDGGLDAECCNRSAGGDLLCGDDCDDSNPRVFWAAGEICDGVNNDCDDSIDEGVRGTYYPDADGDGFGSMGAGPVLACFLTGSIAPTDTDCDDTDSLVHPGAAERCDGARDDNCNSVVDESCACADGDVRGCSLPGRCSAATQSCDEGSWSECGTPGPIAEVCNDIDDDCDGRTDEGVSIVCYTDGDDDGWPWIVPGEIPTCAVDDRDSVGGCPLGFTDRSPSTIYDCNDGEAEVSPDVETDTCRNLRDDDCDLRVDEGCD